MTIESNPAKPALMRAMWVIAALLVGLAMISGDSLWIDELETASIAHLNSAAAAVDATIFNSKSESQMPGYMAYAWFWEKLAGASERQLRMSNLPWLLLAVWCLYRIGMTVDAKLLLPLFLVQPFLWAYLDEFRPYCMQIGGGALLLLGIIQFLEDQGRGVGWSINVAIASVLLCISSMLCAVSVLIAYCYLAWTTWRNKWPVERRAVAVLIVSSALLGCLGAYYVWTLLSGAGGARLWKVGLANLAMVFYEFLGFTGLGPARDSVREAARGGTSALIQTFRPYIWSLAAMACCYALLLTAQLTRRSTARSRLQTNALRMAAFLLVGNILALLALAAVAKWPFWGRHLAPAFAVWCLLLALLAERVVSSWPGRLAVTGLFIALAVSAVTMRLGPAHGHDDYRGASFELKAALDHGERVWWVARGLADSKLYQDPFISPAASQQLTHLISPAADEVAALPPPDLIIISKRDIYDAKESVGAYIENHGYTLVLQLKAFQLWRPGTKTQLSPADNRSLKVP